MGCSCRFMPDHTTDTSKRDHRTFASIQCAKYFFFNSVFMTGLRISNQIELSKFWVSDLECALKMPQRKFVNIFKL